MTPPPGRTRGRHARVRGEDSERTTARSIGTSGTTPKTRAREAAWDVHGLARTRGGDEERGREETRKLGGWRHIRRSKKWRLGGHSQHCNVQPEHSYICKCATDGIGDDCRVVILRGREWVEGGDGGEARRGGPAEIPVQSSFMNPQASALSRDLSAQNRSVKRSKRSPRRALRPSASPPHSWPWRSEIIRPNRGALTSLTDYRQT